MREDTSVASKPGKHWAPEAISWCQDLKTRRRYPKQDLVRGNGFQNRGSRRK